MLTRCKSLDGLLLLHLPSRNSLTLGPPSYVLEEMQRLDALHASTMARLHKNLRNDVGDLPPKVEALFTSADADAGAPDWEALGALIDAELAARKKHQAWRDVDVLVRKTAPHRARPLSESPRRKGTRTRYKGEVTNYVDPNPSYDDSDLQPAEKRDPPTLLLAKIIQTRKEFR